MIALWNWLQGKKTYLTAFTGIVVALGSWYLGQIDAKTAIETIWVALQAMTIRHAL